MSSILQHFNNEVFQNETNDFILIRSVRDRNAKYYFDELIDEYSKGLKAIKIKLVDVQSSYKHIFQYFNVICIDSFESFRKIHLGPATATEDFSEYYVIIFYPLSDTPEEEIQQIFDYYWTYYITNAVLLLRTKNEKSIVLYTYYPFTKKSCKTAQLHIINRDNSLLQLKRSEIFLNKFKYFYNCTLTGALWNVPPYLILPAPVGSSTKEMAGIEGYLLNVLAKVLGFQIEYIIPPNNEQRGLVQGNHTYTGAIKMLNERVADLSLGSFRCTLDRSTVMSPSWTFYQTKQVFTVLALRQPWTSMQIIAYPFDLHIWIVCMVIMIVLLTSPYILQHYRLNVLKFIFGFRSVYFINTNLIAITLSQTASILPQRNFARYILLLWILLTMILRSIYQGSLYDFLKTQQKIPPPNAVNDLIKYQFKLVVNVATYDSFSGVPVIRDKLLKVLIRKMNDTNGFPFLEANPDKRYVTGSPEDFLTYYVKTENKRGVFHILKETIFTQQLCIYFTKHSYLVDIFNHVLQNLRNFGLIDYWAGLLIDKRFLEYEYEININTPLTITQLSGIMEISLFLYFIAAIVFISEMLRFKLKMNKQKGENTSK